MAEIVVLGAGLSGTLMAFEMKAKLGKEDRLTVIGQGDTYHFVPSNPWVAVGWRELEPLDAQHHRAARRVRHRACAAPSRISRFISRTASRMPTNTARDTIAWPMCSSRTPGSAATGCTLK